LQKRRSVDFIYFEAGGGHRSAALALQSVIGSLQYDWSVRLVNLQEVLDPLDIFRKLTRIRLQDIYNLALAKGWTLGSSYLLPWMQAVIRLYHGPQVRLLTEFWREQPPEMVVSLVPNFNRALFESLQRALPGTPFVTILTDFADYPPHFWMEKQDQHLICGTARAVAQAKEMGFDDDHITATSGMILRPEFYNLPDFDRRRERTRLGLDPDLPTGLVLFGGEGSSAMIPIAKRLGDGASDLQLIMICGRNKELLKRLQRLKTKNKFVVEGFTKEIPRYMSIADLFVGKPGPGSISEALKLNLPVIVERNAWTLPQERYNAEWIAEQGVGIVLHNFREVDEAVHKLLENRTLADMKARIASIENQAVFEIPPALARILEKRRHPSG
jgi:1,2-diacylglycerol 3-beta-galactosyltransferase